MLALSIGIKQLLTFYLKRGNRVLTCRTQQPVEECLTKISLHVRMTFGVYHDHTVLIEKVWVIFDQDLETLLVLKTDPRCPVGYRVGVLSGRDVEGCTHAAPSLQVPRATGRVHLDGGFTPQREFFCVCAAIITSRNERCALARNGLQRLRCEA